MRQADLQNYKIINLVFLKATPFEVICYSSKRKLTLKIQRFVQIQAQEVNPVLQGFAALLQCLHPDKGVLKQQDAKGLKRTVCVYRWGTLRTIRYKSR